jgi:hypothetical protein
MACMILHNDPSASTVIISCINVWVQGRELERTGFSLLNTYHLATETLSVVSGSKLYQSNGGVNKPTPLTIEPITAKFSPSGS